MGRIVIVGAGITGLFTAFHLAERGLGRDITIVAKRLPGDYSIEYTSPIAGAYFSCEFAASNERWSRFCRISYGLLKQLFSKFGDELEEAGLARQRQNEFFDHPFSDAELRKFEYVDNFEIVTDKEELNKRGAVFGIRYDSFNFNSPKFLVFFKNYLQGQGVTFVRAQIAQLADAPRAASVPAPAAIFNCTGVTAPQLADFNDPQQNYPVRGQVVLVRAPWITENFCLKQEGHPETYVIPRPRSNGRVVLGGYFEAGDYTEAARVEQTKSILARTTKFVPELLANGDDLEILDVRVGLRPGRDGGPRVEREIVAAIPTIHNYGAGGAGYLTGLATTADAVSLYFGGNAKL